jgi:hypothetical protein
MSGTIEERGFVEATVPFDRRLAPPIRTAASEPILDTVDNA